MGKCWQKIKTGFAFLLFIADVVTDIITLDRYYATQAVSVKVLATISLAFSMILAIPIIGLATMSLLSCARLEVSESARKKDKRTKAFLIFLRYLETIIESIPQLMINIYVWSLSCGNVTEPKRNFTQTVPTSTATSPAERNIFQMPEIQLVSGAFSILAIALTILNFDSMEDWTSEGFEESNTGSFANNPVTNQRKAQNGENDGSDKRLRVTYQYDWLEKSLLIVSKACGFIARVQIVTLAAFYLGWGTSIWFAVHFVIMFYLMRKITGNKFCEKCEDCYDVLFLIFRVLAAQFTWLLDTWAKWIAMTCSLIYCVENVTLLIFVLYCKFTPYCLYSNVKVVNLCLNLACVVFAILFHLKKFGNFQALNEIVKRIGDCAEKHTKRIGRCAERHIKQIETLLCKCNEDRSKGERKTEQHS